LKLCIDLCCGKKGFSRAFSEDPSWEVVSVDIERKFNPSIQADVRYLPIRTNFHPDLVVASPPCERFSLASSAFPKKGIKLAFEIVGAVLEYIAESRPYYYAIENPKGRLRWFLGKPNSSVGANSFGYATVKPNLNFGLLPVEFPKVNRIKRGKKGGGGWQKLVSSKPEDRAELPFGLSLAIKECVN
jgi:hypothetical protein